MFCFCVHIHQEEDPPSESSKEPMRERAEHLTSPDLAPPPDLTPPPGPSPSPLLELLTGSSPRPSPRCSNHSLRFSSDTDSAPSPPNCQPYILYHSRGDWTEESDQAPPSISSLTRHIQTLKKKVRRFEDQFELEMNYKPSHNDKYSNPEMVRVMNELMKARKQLKELRLRQSVFESTEQQDTDMSRPGCGQQGASEHSPVLEDTVESLFRRLKEKREELHVPEDMKEMTQAQMVLEKITLQKCLLYFESLHGRPQRKLVKPLYDRYQVIKRLLCVSPTIISTIEEEDGSDEDAPQVEDDGEPTFVSPIDEERTGHQPAPTTENLHEASRSELLVCLRETRAEKKTRRKLLKEFEEQFYRQTGRVCMKEDRSHMMEDYQHYKQLKSKLRLLEVLLSKQDSAATAM
ncbi:protein FAM13C-like isoform X2 [Gouania willdenowi]|uniref:protein FAM13C-like isoform X2 n=1 Tax=Gouania willdenowi TaxID=441366 RepID=UPI00105645A2|nr:protein FAM13C-like isoform X2 [Gouania willdenowi]